MPVPKRERSYHQIAKHASKWPAVGTRWYCKALKITSIIVCIESHIRGINSDAAGVVLRRIGKRELVFEPFLNPSAFYKVYTHALKVKRPQQNDKGEDRPSKGTKSS